MKLLLLLLAQLTVSIVFSQVTGVVIDKATQLPVPYANIALHGKSYGTTSSVSGTFTIPESFIDQKIIISAIGYASTTVDIKDRELEVLLEPKHYQIEEVVVKPRKSSRKIVVDKLPKDASQTFASNGYSWINANHFDYKPVYARTPFVKQIRILTRSYIRSAKFNVRLITANDLGEPEEELLNKNIIAKARRGLRTVTIDLSPHNFQFPQNGFFVALEWLIIEENRHEYTFTQMGEKKKKKGISYEPKFIVTTKQGASNSWGYHGGNWYKRDFTGMLGRNSYHDLAIELTLTD